MEYFLNNFRELKPTIHLADNFKKIDENCGLILRNADELITKCKE